MHDFWTISTANMMYTRSLNYSKFMVAGKHGIQTFEVVVVVSFDFLSPHVHIPYYFWTSRLSKYT